MRPLRHETCILDKTRLTLSYSPTGMIEVEKKFVSNNAITTRLLEGATFSREHIMTDIYYDTADYALTRKDLWLRSRNGAFELKIPLHTEGLKRKADQYDEIEDDAEIQRVLGVKDARPLSDTLTAHGYAAFCTFVTTRRRYEKDGFAIDIDTVDFGDFTHHIGEIELMVTHKSEVPSAIERILTFAHQYQLQLSPVRGKVIEYLLRKSPKHYAALVAAGVIRDI